MKRSSSPLVSSVPAIRTTGGPDAPCTRRAGLALLPGGVFDPRNARRKRARGGLDARDGRRLRPARRQRGIGDVDPDGRRARGVRRRGTHLGPGTRIGGFEIRFRPGMDANDANTKQTLLQFPVGGKARGVDDAIDAAIDHDRDVLGDRGGDADILLDHEHRHVAVFAEAHQHFLDLGDDDRRQAFGRLVHDEQLRVGQKRARDRQHLLFAARELAAAMVLAFGKAGKRLVDAIDGPGAAPHPGGEAQMLGDAERAPQPPPLRNIADACLRDPRRAEAGDFLAANANRAAARPQQAHDGLAQRGLAHAVAADHREHAGIQRQVDALQCMRMAVIDVEAPDFEGRRGAADLTHGRPPDRVPGPRGRLRSRAAGPP